MENKELTEIDRRLISTSRALLGASRSAVTQVSKGQFMIFDLFNNIWNYNKQLFKQLSEARTMNDMTGIGLHETRRALESAMDNLSLLKQSNFLGRTVDWLVNIRE